MHLAVHCIKDHVLVFYSPKTVDPQTSSIISIFNNLSQQKNVDVRVLSQVFLAQLSVMHARYELGYSLFLLQESFKYFPVFQTLLKSMKSNKNKQGIKPGVQDQISQHRARGESFLDWQHLRLRQAMKWISHLEALLLMKEVCKT